MEHLIHTRKEYIDFGVNIFFFENINKNLDIPKKIDFSEKKMKTLGKAIVGKWKIVGNWDQSQLIGRTI